MVDLLDYNATRFGNLPAIQWLTPQGLATITWAAYRGKVTEVAAGFLSLGIEGGAFVALMARNRAEHLIADLGAVYAGAFPVSFFETLTPPRRSARWRPTVKPNWQWWRTRNISAVGTGFGENYRNYGTSW